MAVYYNLKGTTQSNFQLGKGGITLDAISNASLGIQGTSLVLNNNVTGTPSTNADFTVERGTSANVSIRWNETNDSWEYTNDGSTYVAIGANANNINISAATSTDTTTYPVLVGANTTGNQTPFIDNDSLSYNASTGALTATSFVGSGASLTTLTAANISSGNLGSGVLPYATASSTNSAFQVLFANTTGTTSGNFGLLIDSATPMTYNPSTGTLTAAIVSSSTAFRAANGSLATPSIAFTNDTNTGIYTSGTGTIDFTTDGIQNLRVLGTASADSYWVIDNWNGTGATDGPDIYVESANANCGAFISTKGTGYLHLDGGDEIILRNNIGGTYYTSAVFRNPSTTTGIWYFDASSAQIYNWSGSAYKTISAYGSWVHSYDFNFLQRIELRPEASTTRAMVVSDQVGGTSSGQAQLGASTYGKTTTSSAGYNTLVLGHYRGSSASPSASVADDELGDFVWGALSTDLTYSAVASITGIVETVNTSTVAGGLDIGTHSGTGSALHGQTSRMRFKSTGEIALGTDGWFTFDEHTSAPSTPTAGRVAVYAKADGKIYRKDDTGTETELGGGGGASVTISDTAPGSPTAGDLWWESDTGILKVYYDDGTSSQWVDASPVPAPNAGITVEAKSTSFNAAVNYRYMITGNSVTATLPSSATLGDTIYFVAGTSTITGFTVGRNGLNIMGLAENMTVDDNTNFAFGLVYNDSTNGWRVI